MNINNLGNSYSTYNYYNNTNKTEKTDKTFSLDKTENTASSSSEKISNTEYFDKLCKEYPGVTFRLEDNSITSANGLLKQVGNNFGAKGQCSISIDLKVIEKMQKNPEYESKVKGMIQGSKERYSTFEADALRDGKQYVSVVIEDGGNGPTRGIMESNYPYSQEGDGIGASTGDVKSKLSEQIQKFIEEHKLTAQELKDEKDWRDMTDEEWDEMLGNVDEYLDDVKEYLERMKEMQDEAAMKAATLADSGMRATAASTAALNVAANISGVTTGDVEEVDEETENPNEEEVGSKNWTKNLETDDQLVLRIAKEAQKMENMSLSKLQEVQLTDNTTVGLSESDKLRECASISEDEKHEKVWTITSFTEEGITSNKCQNGKIIDSWEIKYSNSDDAKRVQEFLDSFDKDENLIFSGSKDFWEDFLINNKTANDVLSAHGEVFK